MSTLVLPVQTYFHLLNVILLFFLSLVDSSPLDLTKCGPSLLPSSLTKTTPPPCPSPSSAKQCDWRLIQQRGYTPQDIKACVQLRRSLDAAGENGLAVQELNETHAHLKEPQSGRSRSLQEYMKVSSFTI